MTTPVTSDERLCICADPENCTERVPGYRCKKDFMPRATVTSKQKLDVAVAERLAELADGSNYGTLEDLQHTLLNWSMDLRSGAVSLSDEVPPDETAAAPDDVAKLREEVRIWECRAERAEGFLDGHSAAPSCAKSVLAGDYDYEFAPVPDAKAPAAYCKCAYTDPDGTVVPGEPCPIHPESSPNGESSHSTTGEQA